MPLFLSISLCLIIAFGLGLGLGWVLNSRVAKKHLLNLEETWAARLHDEQKEWEQISAKLGLLINSLQNNYNTAQATIRAHEAALAEGQAKLGDLEARLALQMVELDRTREVLRQEARDWETQYQAVVQAREAEIGRWQSRVWELEPYTERVKEGETKLLQITRDKDAQINRLQRQVRELERGTQTKHWKFSVLLQELDRASAELASFY